MRLERFKADDGEEIRVQVAGHGHAIVLLHEWASSHRVWEADRASPRRSLHRLSLGRAATAGTAIRTRQPAAGR
jgi:pimeloyl-ACP methyl ester carboxylesterase